MNFPLVTVIIPSYNHAEYVCATIDSILKQSYPNLQVIIVDDASSDESQKYINKYVDRPNVQLLFKNKNLGLVDSLNLGLNSAKGKYVALCASDDFWHKDKIAKQVRMFELDSDLKLSFTEGINVDSNGSFISDISYTKRNLDKYYFNDVIEFADLPPASMMFRNEDIIQAGGYKDNYMAEDFLIWLTLLKEGGYAKVLKEKLVFYRNHSQNTHNVYNESVLDSHFIIVDKFSQGLANRDKLIHSWCLRNAIMLGRTNKRKAISYLFRSTFDVSDLRLYWAFFKIFFMPNLR